MDLASLDASAEIAANGHRLRIGPDADLGKWYRWVTFDWSDAGVGTAVLGPFAAGPLEGSAVLVRFPEGTTLEGLLVLELTGTAHIFT